MKKLRILVAVTALLCCSGVPVTTYADEIETLSDTTNSEAYKAELERICSIVDEYIHMEHYTSVECFVVFGSTDSLRYINVFGGNYYGDSDGMRQLENVKEFCELNGFTSRYPFKFESPMPEPEEPSVPDDDIQRISVVDYDTNELIRFENDQEYSISFHTGYNVEYVLTDGTFAWGTMWGKASEWDYNSQNPYMIDISSHAGGFGVSNYEVIDIDLPDGYFLPDDYLETAEYDNDSVDIYIKLKKTVPGDVNDDKEFSVLDAVLFQKWLLNAPDVHLDNWKAVDFNNDGVLNVFDLLLMKKALVEVHSSGNQ